MPHFVQNTSVAFSWTADGQCHGVRVRRLRDKCKVESFWTAKSDKEHSINELLGNGVHELDAKDASCLLASGTAGGWGMADVELPHLAADQIRNALAFELQKHTPLSLDKLTWGFRQISKPTQTTKGIYRIIYVRTDTWKNWCASAESIGQLDMVIPAPAALDPLLKGQSVILPVNGTEQADAWLPSDSGRSYSAASVKNSDGTPKPLSELLNMDFINLDELSTLPPEQQCGFATAILLAVYGLTAEAASDSQTGLPLPSNLRRHHSMGLIFLACALAAVSVAALVLYTVLLLQGNYSQYNELKKEIADVDKLIAAKRSIIKADRLTKIQELRTELQGVVPDYPPFPLALNDITRIIDGTGENKPWISGKLIWSHDTNTIKFSVEEPIPENGEKPFIEQSELLDALNDSPYLVEVRGNSSSVNRNENKITRDFTLTLGWPSAEQRAEAARRNAQREKERRETQRRKRLAEQEAKLKQANAAEMAAAAAAAAAEAVENSVAPADNGTTPPANPEALPADNGTQQEIPEQPLP